MAAELEATVTLVAVSVPLLSIAPPTEEAEFPVKVPPLSVAAVAANRAPPDGAEFDVNVESTTESGAPAKS